MGSRRVLRFTEQRHLPTQADIGLEWGTLLRKRLASLGGGGRGVRPCTYRVLDAYSKRRADIGSTLVAFRAGSQTASSATAESRIGVRINARGSHVFTPNNNPVRNFVSQNAPATPITRPIAAPCCEYLQPGLPAPSLRPVLVCAAGPSKPLIHRFRWLPSVTRKRRRL